RQALPAVLLDQEAGKRTRARDRPPHRGGARRIDRRDRQRAARHPVYYRTALLMSAILIVDDEPGVRAALGGVLRDEGYEVDAVDSGEACLERLGPQADGGAGPA